MSRKSSIDGRLELFESDFVSSHFVVVPCIFDRNLDQIRLQTNVGKANRFSNNYFSVSTLAAWGSWKIGFGAWMQELNLSPLLLRIALKAICLVKEVLVQNKPRSTNHVFCSILSIFLEKWPTKTGIPSSFNNSPRSSSIFTKYLAYPIFWWINLPCAGRSRRGSGAWGREVPGTVSRNAGTTHQPATGCCCWELKR